MVKYTISSTKVYYTMSSTEVSYSIAGYNESFPLFAILLDFIESYGGIY